MGIQGTFLTMRILVTGASGMLGKAVATAFAVRGDDVVVLQRRPSGLALDEILGDISDPVVCQTAVQGADGIAHLAAKVGIVGAWPDYQRINVDGTRTLLNAAKAAGVGRFVQVSSPSVAYVGHSLIGAPAAAADPYLARGFYSRSKALAELLVLGEHSPKFAVVAVRPHLVWGPGDTQLVARIVERGRSRRLVIVGKGTSLIDTTYVDNAAEAVVAAMDNAQSAGGQAYVVSNAEPRPVADIISAICQAARVPGPRFRVPFRLARAGGTFIDAWWSWRKMESDPPITAFLAEQLATAHWFDQQRTQDALNWKPRVSLDEGFAVLTASYSALSGGTGETEVGASG